MVDSYLKDLEALLERATPASYWHHESGLPRRAPGVGSGRVSAKMATPMATIATIPMIAFLLMLKFSDRD